MNLEKETKMLEQALAVWIVTGATILIFWSAAFITAIYIFALINNTFKWATAALAATLLTAGFVISAKKFWRR